MGSYWFVNVRVYIDMMKRILVGITGSPATEAKIAHTLDLARHHEASVSLVSIIDTAKLARIGPVPLGASHMAAQKREERVQASREQAEAALSLFAEKAEAAGIALDIIRREGDPFDVLLNAWRTHDLCILGLRGWFDHGLVSEPEASIHRLIGEGLRPILALTETYRPVDRALIAYDGSIESSKAMKRFMQLRLWPEMEITITCVGKPPEIADALLEEARRYCAIHGFEAKVASIDGGTTPHKEIIGHAEAIDADIVVLGSGLKTTLMQRTFGSTTIAAIQNATRPLFLTH